LVNDSLLADAVSPKDGERDYPFRKYPAVKVARLATHQDYTGRHIGRNMLTKIFSMVIQISRHTGCRIITVDSTSDAVGFYTKMGFTIAQQKQGETIPLYLDFHRFVAEEESRQTTTLSL
jgi:GNAT superfamily N-acetyltransferase